MSPRIRDSVIGALGGVLLCLIVAQNTNAQPSPSPSAVKQEIEELMAAPPFSSSRTGYEWQYRGDQDDEEPEDEDEPIGDPSGFLQFISMLSTFLGTITEVLLWALVIIVIALIIIYRDRWMGLFARTAGPQDVRLPAAIFGRDEAAEVLPNDIASSAWQLWQAGEHRGCLSLLYRGALWSLIAGRHVELADSATEEDCLRIVIAGQGDDLSNYFAELTRTWQRVAYAAHIPDEPSAKTLCDRWPQHFGMP